MVQLKFTITLLSMLVSLLFTMSSVLAKDWVYTVRPGDNLSDLSEKYLSNQKYVTKLKQINNITTPAKLLAGTVIRFPIKWLKIQPSFVLVTDGHGDVTIIRSSSNNPVTNKEVRLYFGDRIVTGKNSSAMLIFADKSRLLLQSSSELIMDKLTVYGDGGMADTRLRLPKGRVDAQIIPKKINRSRYEITTPAAVAAVRGTEFRVSAENSRPVSRSEVLKGLVAVGSNGANLDVPAGFGTVSEAGKPPPSPKKLLPPPDLVRKQELYTQIPILFLWKSQDNAQSYRVQLFNQKNLNTLLLDKVVTKNQYQFKSLSDDSYLLRIRGIDSVELEGFNRDHVFTVNAVPGKSILNKPLNNSILTSQSPDFSWSSSLAALKYRFQIASDELFKNVIVDRSDIISTQHQTTEILPAGQYYWRVAGIDDSGRGSYSNVRSFKVRPVLPVPVIRSPIISKNNIDFKWNAISKNIDYYFQFTRDLDENNTDEYQTIVLNDTSLSLPHSFTGHYYYRIKAVKKDNSYAESNYSAWQKVEIPIETNLPWYMLILLIILL